MPKKKKKERDLFDDDDDDDEDEDEDIVPAVTVTKSTPFILYPSSVFSVSVSQGGYEKSFNMARMFISIDFFQSSLDSLVWRAHL